MHVGVLPIAFLDFREDDFKLKPLKINGLG